MVGPGFGSKHAQDAPAELDGHESSALTPGPFSNVGEVLRFNRCTLVPSTRTLLLDGQPVEIGSRAFDLLTLLVMAHGRLVTKAEIMNVVWPLTIVAESNLRFQIACLRRALCNDHELIKTIPGRGYIFVGEIKRDKPGGPMQDGREPPHRAGPPHASAASEHNRDGASAGNDPDRDGPDVVLIEDDDSVREALFDLLSSVCFSVETYPDVVTFLENPSRRSPKCMILDIWLPGQSGLDFQADLKKANIQTPIIFISGHADVPMSVQAMKAGAVEFLIKPVRHEDLLGAVRSAVSGETRDH